MIKATKNKEKKSKKKEEISYDINTLENDTSKKQKVDILANAEGAQSKWIRIEAAVDSGAVDPVINAGKLLPHLPIRQTPESERGEEWTAAGGGKIPKEGEVTIEWLTNDHRRKRSKMKVGNVGRTLISVSRLNECGYEAFLNKRNPRLVHSWNGECIPLRKSAGMFLVDMWVKVPISNEGQGFHRHP